MTIEIIYCTGDVFSDKLKKLTSSNKISHIPIVKNKIPIGIIYIVDIVNILIEKNIILKLNVKNFISG